MKSISLCLLFLTTIGSSTAVAAPTCERVKGTGVATSISSTLVFNGQGDFKNGIGDLTATFPFLISAVPVTTTHEFLYDDGRYFITSDSTTIVTTSVYGVFTTETIATPVAPESGEILITGSIDSMAGTYHWDMKGHVCDLN